MKQIYLTAVAILCFAYASFAKTDTIETDTFDHSLFGNIFTAFYYSPGERATPPKGFELSTGLLGYKASWGKKATATLIYDVFRTTDHIEVLDSNNNPLDVEYFRGSDYTGFLKMAQIDLKINQWLLFSVGQLLNQQYLTYQDRFWGFRYISTTFQERYRFGAPADFGARLTFQPHNNLNLSIGSVNGKGPFRVQSDDGNMQYFTNIEWTPFEGYIIKLFADIAPSNNYPSRSVVSFFTGYKTDLWRLGLELNLVENELHDNNNDLRGISMYGACKISDNWHLFARHDYIIKSIAFENEHYIITGIEYEPYKGFYTSINYRYLTQNETSWLFASFGARF